MPKINVKEENLDRYEKVRREQEKLKKRYDQKGITEPVLCPYCQRKLAMRSKGLYDVIEQKCSKCSRIVIVPPTVVAQSE